MIGRLRPRDAPLGELRYTADLFWLGWLGVPVGVWLLDLVSTSGLLESSVRWVCGGFGAGLLVAGLLSATWRHELVLRLARGRYVHRHGPRWLTQLETRGDFAEIQGVSLTREIQDWVSNRLQAGHYQVMLVRQDRAPLIVASSMDRSWAWTEARKLALALGRALHDASSETHREWTVDQLRVDQTLRG